jgi:hypothetical protein
MVETASAVLDAQVIEPFPDAVGGLDRFHRLVDAYPPHLETEPSAAHQSASSPPRVQADAAGHAGAS